MRFLVIVLFAVIGSQVQAAELCAKYNCSASPKTYSVHSNITVWGFGNTVPEATKNALKRCLNSNSYARDCSVSCSPYHGPAYPIFSSCVDQWKSKIK